MSAQNCSQELTLNFKGETFEAIKFFGRKLFTGSCTECKPEISMSKGGYETSGPP